MGRASATVLNDMGFLRGTSWRRLEELEGDVHVLGRGSCRVRWLSQGEDGLGGGDGVGSRGLVVEGCLPALAWQTVLVFLGEERSKVSECGTVIAVIPLAFIRMGIIHINTLQ